MELDCAIVAATCFNNVKMQRRRCVWGRAELACMVISSVCACDRGGLQLLRLLGSLAENGMAAGILLHCFGAPVMARRRWR